MKTIDDIRAALREPAASLASLTAAADAARAMASAAEADIADLNGRRPDVALNGSDKDLAKLDDAIAGASRSVERATALADACTARAAEVQSEAAEHERRTRYDAAVAVSAKLAKTFPDKYRRLVALTHEMLSDIGEARALVAAVNRDLPEDAEALPHPEAFRTTTSRAKIVAKDAVTLWCHEDGTPVSAAQQGSIVPQGGGIGIRPAFSQSSADPTRYRQKAGWRVTVQPPTDMPGLQPFDVALSIPPLFSGEAEGWRQSKQYPEPIETRLRQIRDHQRPTAPAPIEEVIAADGLDDLKRRHRIA